MSAFFKRIFGLDENTASKPEVEIEPPAPALVEKRLQAAAESILDNEALTAALDDDAAKIVFDWGLAHARQIAAETIGMDEAAAEEFMYQPGRSLRKMLRAINHWVMAPDKDGLQKIIEQAQATYGSEYIAPDSEQISQFLEHIDQWSGDQLEMIHQLRNFIENQTSSAFEDKHGE